MHYDLTLEWAVKAGFLEGEAKKIAAYDIGTDFSLANPVTNPGWHLFGYAETVSQSVFQNDSCNPFGSDRRLVQSEVQLALARELLKNSQTREQGLRELGKGLHALQDIEAHMYVGWFQHGLGSILSYLPGIHYVLDDPEWDYVNGRWIKTGEDLNSRLIRTKERSIAYLKRALK